MLNGIYPPLTTPFRNDEVAYDKLRENIKKYNYHGFSGYVVFGSNGESVFLSNSEKLKLLKTVREQTPEGKNIIAGTGLESIRETITLSNEAANAGADYALIITPHFFANAMTPKAMVIYYTTVADSVKIPVIIYNVTKFTNVNLTLESVVKLSEHPNIIGIKNSNENIAEVTAIIANTNKKFSTLIGTGSVLLPALIAGANGGILALANVAPKECLKIYSHYNQEKLKEAQKIQNKLIAVNKAITSMYGVAGLKTAMGHLGFYGGRPRKPLQPLSSAKVNHLKMILREAGLCE